MGNPVTWVELTTHNLEGAKEFYAKLFDWKLRDWSMPGLPYFAAETGSEPGVGMMGIPEPGVPTAWMMYVLVDDIVAACAKIGQMGGKVWKESTEIPGQGHFAVVCDPQGAYFGLWQKM